MYRPSGASNSCQVPWLVAESDAAAHFHDDVNRTPIPINGQDSFRGLFDEIAELGIALPEQLLSLNLFRDILGKFHGGDLTLCNFYNLDNISDSHEPVTTFNTLSTLSILPEELYD